MSNYTIPNSGTLILQFPLSIAGPVSSSPPPMVDLSNYEFQVNLKSEQMCIINSVTESTTYSTKGNSGSISCDRNVITLVVPIETISANDYYQGSVTIKNDSFSLVLTTFQLVIDANTKALPAMIQCNVTIDPVTYQLLAQNNIVEKVIPKTFNSGRPPATQVKPVKLNATYVCSWGGNSSYLDAFGGAFSTAIVPVDSVPSSYNTLIYAFIETAPATVDTPVLSFSPDPIALVKTRITTAQNKGQRVLVSIGGQTATFAITTAAHVTNFVNGVLSILNTYGFDGLDIDVESGSFGSNSTLFGQAVLQIVTTMRATNPKFYLTIAPEWPVLTSGAWYDGFITAVGISNISAVMPQSYNQGILNPVFDSLGNPVTPSMGMDLFVETLVKAFTTSAGNATNPSFIPIPASKFVICLPAANGAAALGYTLTSTQMTSVWNNLKSQGLDLLGFCNWSADFDAMPNLVGNVNYDHIAWEFGQTAASLIN